MDQRAAICGIALVAATSLTVAAASHASAKEKAWYKYENSFFEAYSDAPEKKVRRLLGELENFRAATVQVMGLDIPRGAAKTQVLIFGSGRDFHKVADDKLVGAFVAGMNGIPYLVMPVGGRPKSADRAIRHEYAHVLLGYRGHRYPLWYQEGFAEMMSATEFRSGGSEFTIGQTNGRGKSAAPLISWEELISDRFEMHAIEGAGRRSNAYLQSWLLVHHLTLGDGMRHAGDLGRYLTLYAGGASSGAAFESVFGMAVGELGDRLVKTYKGRVPAYIVPFQPGMQDPEFSSSEADSGAVQATIDALTRKFREATR